VVVVGNFLLSASIIERWPVQKPTTKQMRIRRTATTTKAARPVVVDNRVELDVLFGLGVGAEVGASDGAVIVTGAPIPLTEEEYAVARAGTARVFASVSRCSVNCPVATAVDKATESCE
jgi:hypothetical protein